MIPPSPPSGAELAADRWDRGLAAIASAMGVGCLAATAVIAALMAAGVL